MNRKPVNWNKYSYTEEELRLAIKENISCHSTLRALGLDGTGAGYKVIKRLIDILSIDTSHWSGQGHLKGKNHNWNYTTPLEEILVQNSNFQSFKLKKRLIKSNLIQNKCNDCGIDKWRGKEISLHLDHINGCNTDNRLENLRLLCPNCHSQTPTYCGKNKKKR